MTATVFEPDLSLDLDSLTREERVEALLAADAMRSPLEAWELRIVGAFDAAGDFAYDGTLNAAGWMGRRLDMTRSAAAAMVKDAARLRRPPCLHGRRVDPGDGEGAGVRAGPEPPHRPRVHQDGGHAAGCGAAVQVDETILLARRFAVIADTNGTQPPEQKQSVSMGRTGDALHGSLTLHGEDAALFTNTLDREMDAIYRTDGEAGHQTPTERRAQPLMNLIRLAAGANASTDPAKPAFIVHIDLDQLEKRAGHRLAEIDPFGPLSTLAVERLLCDAGVHRLVRDAQSAVINFGRSERLAKGLQRLAIIARDRHCTFPGCDRPPQ